MPNRQMGAKLEKLIPFVGTRFFDCSKHAYLTTFAAIFKLD